MATFFIALLGAAIGLAGGFFAGALVGALIAAATHMSTFEGAAGYFAVFLCGPVGALLGLVLGVWLALLLRGEQRGGGAIAKYSLSSVGTIAGASAVAIFLVLHFDSNLNRGGSEPQLLFEIRMPPGSKVAGDRHDVDIELNTDANSASAFLRQAQHNDGDRPVVSGGVELAFRTANRILVLKRKDEPDRLFKLTLAARPRHSDDYGEWRPVDGVADPGAERPRPATAADQYEIRYRVRDPEVEYMRPIVAFELSLPPASHVPEDVEAISVKALEGQNDIDGAISAGSIKRGNDRVILEGTVQMAGDVHSLVAISIPDQPTRLFEIHRPPLDWITELLRRASTTPDDTAQTYGPWEGARFIREAVDSEPRAAASSDDAKLRYMLQ
ncbi:MAG TPA: hypothetical protein VN634_12960 [Candidatus Limnocylindrales bacterium]|nr:hypothetical protein [Candidatus Limnocylindrales bacterium]